MRQTRLSIGCRDWQAIIETIGPEAAGILLYLLSMMRSMQAAEVSIRISELAAALHLSNETAETALASIQVAGYLEAAPPLRQSAAPLADAVITLRSDEEEKRQNEARRKRAARLLSRFQGQSTGQSGDTFFDKNGQSAGQSGRSQTCTEEVRSAPRADNIQKEYKTEIMMTYDPKTVGRSEHTLFNHTGQESKKEKNPPTPKKEKSLTESTGHAHASAPVREAANASTGRQMSAATRADQIELAADQLEADYIDVCGLMPQSLRDAIRLEQDDVREAFYLYVRQRREEEGSRWAGDRIRIAWLAARRIPAERRAESILAAAMGGWKTIRDAGSGCYFEKTTGRIVSLVRGPVEYKPQTETEKINAELAVKLAKNMRRG